ncbi:hypothetical protein Tco_1193996, partial [Tanacetum coccineum]
MFAEFLGLMKSCGLSKPLLNNGTLISKKTDRTQNQNAMIDVKYIEQRIDDGIATPLDSDKHIQLLQEIDKLDNFEAIDLIQKAHIKWDTIDKFQPHDSQVVFLLLVHSTCLCSLDREYMETHVSLDEINSVVWECGSNKASGPDGVNSSFFTLIPKVNNPIFIKDFRHISLTGIHYKIKILANQLSKVINKIVSNEQSAFILVRQVLNEYVILREKYFDFVLHNLGFRNKWRSWIRACLRSSRTSVFVNGSPTLEFSIKRGLSSNLIHGIKLGSPNITVSYLFYADDVIVTTEWNPVDLENINHVLHVFYLASDIRINIQKSNINGIGVFDEEGEAYSHQGDASLKSFNLALLQKWRWRLFSSPNALWVKVIKAFHGHEGGFENHGCKFNGTWDRIVDEDVFSVGEARRIIDFFLPWRFEDSIIIGVIFLFLLLPLMSIGRIGYVRGMLLKRKFTICLLSLLLLISGYG